MRIVFLIFGFVTISVNSQIKNLNLELSSSYVTDVKIQENGLMWVGTEEGLDVLYDNEKHVFYSNISDSTSILNSKINKLFLSSVSDLFVLTEDGISIYNPQTFDFKQIPLRSTPVSVVEDLSNSMFWVATETSGYYVIDKSFNILHHFVFDPLNPLSISTSNTISNTSYSIDFYENKVFVATVNGFNIFDQTNNTFKRYFAGEKTKLTSSNILGVKSFKNKVLIVGENELVSYNISDSSFNLVSRFENGITRTEFLNDGGILIQTSLGVKRIDYLKERFDIQPAGSYPDLTDKKVFQISDYTFIWQKGTQELSTINADNRIKDLVVNESINSITGKDKTLYFGTSNGVMYFDSKESMVKEHSNEDVESLYFKNYENQLIQVSENGFNVYELGTYNLVDLVSTTNVKIDEESVFESFENYILIANDNISFYDIKNGLSYENVITQEQLKNFEINNLKVIDEKLYASHDMGIFEFDVLNLIDRNLDSDFISYEYNELLNAHIPKGFVDIEQIGEFLYVTSDDKNLVSYPKDFSNIIFDYSFNGDSSKSLAASTIQKLQFINEENNLYIASLGNGLFTLDLSTQEFQNYNVTDGLLSNNVYDFLTVDGSLYFQSGTGINFLQNNLIKNFSEEDGLKFDMFHKESLHAVGDDLIVSGGNGIQIIPFDFFTNIKSESFELNLFRAVGIDKLNSKSDINFSGNSLQVDYTTKTLILDLFSSVRYKSDQIQFIFEQTGVKDFIANGFNNQIQLNGLPYYESSIKVYGINSNGERSVNDLNLTIYNAPPWWLRYESIAAYIILMFIGMRFFVKYRETKTKERLEGERKSEELEEARQLQLSLLPKKNPDVENYDISTYLKSATEIGGDYYDFFYKNGEYFYAVCGDATGHGVVSGIMVSVTKAGLNGIPMGEPSLILEQLNRIVKRVNFGRLRMSLSVAKFNEDNFEITSAAMPPTYYYKAASAQVEEILVPNLPLGGIESEKYTGVTKKFEQNDVMVMISDGLPELPNSDNILLDYDEIEKCIGVNAHKSSEEIKNALVNLADQWSNGIMNPDDITIVVIKKVA